MSEPANGLEGQSVGANQDLPRARYEGRLSFGYVRRYYGVPAKRGMRVTVEGKPGRITSGNGHYIRVLFDGERRPRICHPTWEVVYEPDGLGSSVEAEPGPEADYDDRWPELP